MKNGCTQMHADAVHLNELSGHAIGCAFTVLDTLGTGYLEKVYQNAMAHDLRQAALAVVAALRSHMMPSWSAGIAWARRSSRRFRSN